MIHFIMDSSNLCEIPILEMFKSVTKPDPNEISGLIRQLPPKASTNDITPQKKQHKILIPSLSHLESALMYRLRTQPHNRNRHLCSATRIKDVSITAGEMNSQEEEFGRYA